MLEGQKVSTENKLRRNLLCLPPLSFPLKNLHLDGAFSQHKTTKDIIQQGLSEK